MYYFTELKKSINPYIDPLAQKVQQVSQKAIEVKDKITPQVISYMDQYIIKPQYLHQIVDRIYYMPLPKDDKFQELGDYLNETFKENYYLWNIGEYVIPCELFNNQVNECNIVGFPCPTLKLIFAICKQILTWLNGDPLNQAIVNCQASLGRSVLLISCLLCLMKQFSHPGEAVTHISQILRTKESEVLFATHQLYLQYFVNVKNGIQLNIQYIVIQKIIINGIPFNQNADENQQFVPYLQIFDEKNILFNSIKGLKEKGGGSKLSLFDQNDSAISFDVNLEVEPEQDILIRCKHFESKTTRFPVFRILLNTGFVFDEVVRFYKKDIEFSPFYEPKDGFFIDFTIQFLQKSKPFSELQQTYKSIESNQFKDNDENIKNIMDKGINQQSQINNLDFSIESHDDQNLQQEITQSLNVDCDVKDEEKVPVNNEQNELFQKIGDQVENEDEEEEDLDDYFNQLEND